MSRWSDRVVVSLVAMAVVATTGCAQPPSATGLDAPFRPTERATSIRASTDPDALEHAAAEYRLTDDELVVIATWLYVVIDARHSDAPSVLYGDPELLAAMDAIAGRYPSYFERVAHSSAALAGAPLIGSRADFEGRCGVDCRPSASLVAGSLEVVFTRGLEELLEGTPIIGRARQIALTLSLWRVQGGGVLAAARGEISRDEAIELIGNLAGAFVGGAALVGASGPAVTAATAISLIATLYGVFRELSTVGALVTECLEIQARCDAGPAPEVDAGTTPGTDAGGGGASDAGMAAMDSGAEGPDSGTADGSCTCSSGGTFCTPFGLGPPGVPLGCTGPYMGFSCISDRCVECYGSMISSGGTAMCSVDGFGVHSVTRSGSAEYAICCRGYGADGGV